MIANRFKLMGITIGLLSVFALGVLVVNPFGQASAAKMDRALVCHYEEEVLDEETGAVVEFAEWKIIEINGNALPAHLGDENHPGHGDGEYTDQLVDDSDEPGEDTVTSAECLARNGPSEG